MEDPQVAGGTFTLRFDTDRFLLRLYCFFTRFRFRYFHYGDQGIFVRRSVFENIGGYRDLPIKAFGEGLRKQLRVKCELCQKKLAVLRQITEVSLIVGFTVKGQTNMMSIHGWLFWGPPIEFSTPRRITPFKKSSVRFFIELFATHKIRWHQKS
jgi:hypothetical protein